MRLERHRRGFFSFVEEEWGFLATRGVPGGQRGFRRKMRKEGEIVFAREKGEGEVGFLKGLMC